MTVVDFVYLRNFILYTAFSGSLNLCVIQLWKSISILSLSCLCCISKIEVYLQCVVIHVESACKSFEFRGSKLLSSCLCVCRYIWGYKPQISRLTNIMLASDTELYENSTAQDGRSSLFWFPRASPAAKRVSLSCGLSVLGGGKKNVKQASLLLYLAVQHVSTTKL